MHERVHVTQLSSCTGIHIMVQAFFFLISFCICDCGWGEDMHCNPFRVFQQLCSRFKLIMHVIKEGGALRICHDGP